MSKDGAKSFIKKVRLDNQLNSSFMKLLGKPNNEMLNSIVTMGAENGFAFNENEYIAVCTSMAIDSENDITEEKKHIRL